MCSTDDSYDLGEQIEQYDVFLSHDWATSRWLKLCSMMIIFNSHAAFWSSFIVSVITGFLRAFEVIPDQMWTISSGYVVYLLVLCFWQRLRRVFFRPLIVFVDKLCIAQHDEELKEKGILALAGFLDHSRKLTVLWSPRYFQRLWCAYELAAYSRAEEKPLQVMPVKMSMILGLTSICWHFLCVTFHLIAWTETSSDPVFSQRLTASFFTMLLLCTLMPGVCYVGIQLMDDLTQLPQQLKSFRIQESKCFCCTSNHVHPVTGRGMICDRSLVFHTLKKWFGSRADADHEGSHLELFNQMIQQELSQSILQTVGWDTAPLTYCIYMVSAGNVPFIAQYIARTAAELRGESSMLNHGVASARQFMSWATISLLSICAVRVSIAFWKLGLRITRKHANSNVFGSPAMISVLISPVIVFTLSLLWLPFQVAYALTSNHSSIPAIPFGIVIIATFYLFIPNVGISHNERGSSLRQKLSDRYQSRRTRRSRLSGMQSSTSELSTRRTGTLRSNEEVSETERSRFSKDIFSDHSIYSARVSKEMGSGELPSLHGDSKELHLEELPSLSPKSRGSKDLFTHVNSEKSRASKEEALALSRSSSLASIETIAAGSRVCGLESFGLDASQSDVVKVTDHSDVKVTNSIDSGGIDSFGLEQIPGGLQMRLESCGSELPGAVSRLPN